MTDLRRLRQNDGLSGGCSQDEERTSNGESSGRKVREVAALRGFSGPSRSKDALRMTARRATAKYGDSGFARMTTLRWLRQG